MACKKDLMNNSKIHCVFLPLDSFVPQTRNMAFSFAGAGRILTGNIIVINVTASDYFF